MPRPTHADDGAVPMPTPTPRRKQTATGAPEPVGPHHGLIAPARTPGMRAVGAELVERREIVAGQWMTAWHSPSIVKGSRAGQYVHVRTFEAGGLPVRKPYPIVTADAASGTLAIHAPGAPPGGGWLDRLRPGDTVEMIGPLGRPFEVDPRSRHLLLMAEGAGVGAIRLLIDEAVRDGRSVTLLFGARSSAEVYPTSLLPDEVEYVVATADGSLGQRGSVLDLVLDYEAWADQAFAAGPPSLLDAIARLASGRRGRLGVATLGRKRGGGRPPAAGSPEARRKAWLQVLVQAEFGCAAGTCLGCVVAGSSGPRPGLPRGSRSSRRTSSMGADMKPKRRALTAKPGGVRTKRTPTVRRFKPAITPVRPKAPASTADTASSSVPDDTALDAIGGRPVSLEIDLGRGLVLENPVIVASGPFGYGVEVADAVDLARLGGIVTRSTTLRPRSGHPAPRMADVPAGVLLGMGLQNPGIEVVLDRYAPTWAKWPVPVIVSLAGESASDVVDAARRLEGVPGVAGIELNLSCVQRVPRRVVVRPRRRGCRARSCGPCAARPTSR